MIVRLLLCVWYFPGWDWIICTGSKALIVLVAVYIQVMLIHSVHLHKLLRLGEATFWGTVRF